MMAIDLNRLNALTCINALTFDVEGTMFDWHHTICNEIECLARARGVDLDGALFTNHWRSCEM